MKHQRTNPSTLTQFKDDKSPTLVLSVGVFKTLNWVSAEGLLQAALQWCYHVCEHLVTSKLSVPCSASSSSWHGNESVVRTSIWLNKIFNKITKCVCVDMLPERRLAHLGWLLRHWGTQNQTKIESQKMVIRGNRLHLPTRYERQKNEVPSKRTETPPSQISRIWDFGCRHVCRKSAFQIFGNWKQSSCPQ